MYIILRVYLVLLLWNMPLICGIIVLNGTGPTNVTIIEENLIQV
jgi:hypothetical protein